MVLAELEVFQSRPIAPTRRLALGSCVLPVSPAPGFGGLLLGAVAAAFVTEVDVDLRPDLERLSHQVEQGLRIPQPRLRHRFQTDHVGLNRRQHRLLGDGERMQLDLDDAAGTSPGPQVLAAIYAAGRLPIESRGPVMRVIRRGLLWRGAVDDHLLEHIGGTGAAVTAVGRYADPEAWALGVLGLVGPSPDRKDVQRRFRDLLRVAHPDHGGGQTAAAERIAELTEARRILLVT
ncbi:J domain-containing protein [Iamia majanohamensis]|uniref:J domain-containing protein n=1 Tax=Iamia majanohamensis TaxID=467976 RepID=A0AAE9Y503_9ACTN|nr:J domain-containing protein [Iamia majanohamensis]WCO66420.1 J domain-containing protein [Iamia majanohamensis]